MAGQPQVWGAARLEVQGYRELMRDMYLAGAESEDLKAITRPLAEKIAASGRALAPKKTGRLAGAIKAKNSRISVTAYIPARIKYAAPLHWGRDGASGPQFLSKAEQTNRTATYAGIEAGINRLLTKHNL